MSTCKYKPRFHLNCAHSVPFFVRRLFKGHTTHVMTSTIFFSYVSVLLSSHLILTPVHGRGYRDYRTYFQRFLITYFKCASKCTDTFAALHWYTKHYNSSSYLLSVLLLYSPYFCSYLLTSFKCNDFYCSS